MDPVLRILFGLILFFHAIIHLMGMIKAFKPQRIPQLSRKIPKPEGIVWLIAGVLLLGALVLFALRENGWSALAIVGAIVSQFVVSLNWKEAKYGTIANLLILSVSLPAYGQTRFSEMTTKEAVALLTRIHFTDTIMSVQYDQESLPPVISKWIQRSGAAEKPEIFTVRLKQEGRMKATKSGEWMPFTAVQYFNAKDPSFIWTTQVNPLPIIYLEGRDKLQGGEGEMLINFLSLFKLVDEKENEKVNSGSMIRFLAEICWFPSAALEPYMEWEELNPTAAQGTLSIADKSVSGIFRFNEEGDLLSFETSRYYGGGENAKKENWRVEVVEYGTFEGVRVPTRSRVTWKLPDGDFTWLHLDITDLEYNEPVPYL